VVEQMRYRPLYRRLGAIEAKSDEAARAVEREHRLTEERSISAEEAERTYRQLMAPARTGDSRKLNLNQVMAQYFRMVRGTAPSQGKRR
jgi:hypothetical protein